MAKYNVTFRLDAPRQASAEKKLKEVCAKVLGENCPTIEFTVEKVKTAESRADRLAKAESLVDSGRQIVEELKDEMEQWRDSIPENLQGGDKYQAVDDATTALDELQSNLEGLEWSVEFPGLF